MILFNRERYNKQPQVIASNTKATQTNKMAQCCAKTAKGTRCQLGACEASDCGLCATHHKKHEKDPKSVVFFEIDSDVDTEPTESFKGKGKMTNKPKGSPKAMARNPDDDETSWNTNELYDTAMNLLPDIDDDVMQIVNTNTNSSDVWGSIAANFTNPTFTLPNKKQKAPKKRLTPKLLLNLSLWMFYRDCCKKQNINNVIRNQIIREGLVKGALLATKDKIVEENGVAKTVKVEIIPYQLVKYATDQVWQKLPEAMKQKYLQAVRDDYTRRAN